MWAERLPIGTVFCNTIQLLEEIPIEHIEENKKKWAEINGSIQNSE